MMRAYLVAPVAVLVLTGAALCGQEPSPSCANDEGARDQSLVAFRLELLAALRSHDFDRLRPLLATDVDASSFGPDPAVGPDAFRSTYKLDDQSSPYWMEFERLISIGGRFREEGFCTPYFSCPPPAEESGDVIIVERDVSAHAQPSNSSPVLGRLSCTVVKPAGVRAAPGWFGVLLNGEQVAFVPSTAIDRPDMFLLFRQENGRWRLAAAQGFD